MHCRWQVKDAIPAFEELVVPLASAVMADSTEGRQLRDSISMVRNGLVDGVAAVTSSSSSSTDLLAAEVQTNFQAGLDLVDQLPGLLRMIADGTVEFTPSPDDTRESCRRMYRARRTLLLEFENDSIDESEELESVIQEAKDIMRLKRPMVKFDIRLEKITGTHITPLTQVSLFNPREFALLLNLVRVTSSARRMRSVPTGCHFACSFRAPGFSERHGPRKLFEDCRRHAESSHRLAIGSGIGAATGATGKLRGHVGRWIGCSHLLRLARCFVVSQGGGAAWTWTHGAIVWCHMHVCDECTMGMTKNTPPLMFDPDVRADVPCPPCTRGGGVVHGDVPRLRAPGEACRL